MTKMRVYELAKELNTTSKRLMEKLAEIKIVVKNHMSLLEENELEALYDHIGVIRHNEDKIDTDDRKNTSAHPVVQQGSESIKEVRKETKNAPRIIRTTEINLDSKGEVKEVRTDGLKNQKRGNDKRRKNDFVRVTTSTSGLRPGFVRDTKPDYKKLIDNDKKSEAAKNAVSDKNKDIEKGYEKENIKRDAPVFRQDIDASAKKEEAPKLIADTKDGSKIMESKEAQEQKNIEVIKDVSSDNVKTPSQKAQTQHSEENRNLNDNKQIHSGKNNVINNTPSGNNNVANTPPVNRRDDFRKNDFKKNDFRKNDFKKDGTGAKVNDFKKDGAKVNDFKKDGAKSNDFKRDGTRNNDFKRNDNRGGDFKNNNFKKNDFKNNDPKRNDSGRPQGGNFANRQNNRPGGDRGRDMNRAANKPLEIPKVELTPSQREELNSQRAERRDFNRDIDKDSKRELKKEAPKGALNNTGRNKNNKAIKNAFTGKKEVSEVLSDDFALEEYYLDGVKKIRKVRKPRRDEKNEGKHIPPKAVLTQIKIPETLTVKELAEALKKTSAEVIKKLIGLGIMATLNQEVDFDTATIIADEFGVKAEKEVIVNEEDILFDESEEDDANAVQRPPVVVVMGHVDHGKTSLLDAIKETNVTESEAGGITQHIGAYMVKINNRNITFLDTPGHEAFTAMRARGAQVTDVAILVVAADDGVMPQTAEAINHAKAANVTIIVAINKIDKPGANPERVKQELTEYGLVSEEWGGDTICVEVSAKERTNIDHLLEMVLLAADMLELKANPDRQAKGTVIEAKLDKDRGPVATVLVQRGTLNIGDSIVTGTIVGRIRAMTDDRGHKIKKAGPSTPVEILGMPDVPEAGEIFYAITDEKVAKQLAEKRKFKQREQQLKSSARVSLDDLFNQIKEGKVKDLNIIVKADVQGSVEAVKQSLEKLSNDEVRVRIVHGGVGAVTESDVTLAQVSNAIIIGFNVRPSANVMDAAKEVGVDLRLYRVIYNAIEDIQSAMKGMLDPTYKEVVLGHIEIRQTFKVSGIGTIGGGYVTDGKVVRNSDIRMVREGIVIHEGKLASLKRFKDDVKEVSQGFECGLSIERFNDLKEGDIVEAFAMEEVKS